MHTVINSYKKNQRACLLPGVVFSIFILMLFKSDLWADFNDQVIHIQSISERIKTPLRLTIGNANARYVTDYTKKSICCYDSSGFFKSEINIGFLPTCIASPNGRNLYVGDTHAGRIVIMDSSGQVINSFGDFEQPSDAVFDDTNLLYVVDSKKNQVSVFNCDGIFLRAFGNEKLNFPTGIAFDNKNQRILVAEHGGITPADSSGPTAKIHIFDKEGNWITAFGQYGAQNGRFSRIQGLAVDPLGRIYAVDSFQGAVTVLDEQGVYIGKIGEYGSASAQLRLPMDVALDAHKRLWITSLNNSRIEVFDIKDLPTAIKGEPEPKLPMQNRLLQNYPNPFNPSTAISYQLSTFSQVNLTVYSISGQKVRELVNRKQKAGVYSVSFDASGLASGVYFYKLQTDQGFIMTKKLLFVK